MLSPIVVVAVLIVLGFALVKKVLWLAKWSIIIAFILFVLNITGIIQF